MSVVFHSAASELAGRQVQECGAGMRFLSIYGATEGFKYKNNRERRKRPWGQRWTNIASQPFAGRSVGLMFVPKLFHCRASEGNGAVHGIVDTCAFCFTFSTISHLEVGCHMTNKDLEL